MRDLNLKYRRRDIKNLDVGESLLLDGSYTTTNISSAKYQIREATKNPRPGFDFTVRSLVIIDPATCEAAPAYLVTRTA